MHCLEVIKKRDKAAFLKDLDHRSRMWQKGFEAGYERAMIENGLPVNVTPSVIKRYVTLGQKTWKTITDAEKREYDHLQYLISAMVKHAWENRGSAPDEA